MKCPEEANPQRQKVTSDCKGTGNENWYWLHNTANILKMYSLKMVKTVPSFSVSFLSTFKTAHTHTKYTVALDSSSSGMHSPSGS